MSIRLHHVPFAEVKPEVAAHLEGLSGPIDSFHEEHVRDARFYRIVLADQPIGLTAIYETNLITWFTIDPPHRQHSQQAFAAVRKTEFAVAAFVTTADGFFLANAIDNVREIKRQAYAFALAPDRPRPSTSDYRMRLAAPDDVPGIREVSGEFFGAYLDQVGVSESMAAIYVVSRGETPVAYGVSERSHLYRATTSIGMFVREEQRQTGAGTATIGLLIDEVLRRGETPVAGCWYYNHASKRTLERAGLYAATRLLRIEY